MNKREAYEKVNEIQMMIPNMVADDVPLGRNDEENVEAARFGEAIVPDYEIPYHSDIMSSFDGLDKEAAEEYQVQVSITLWGI